MKNKNLFSSHSIIKHSKSQVYQNNNKNLSNQNKVIYVHKTSGNWVKSVFQRGFPRGSDFILVLSQTVPLQRCPGIIVVSVLHRTGPLGWYVPANFSIVTLHNILKVQVLRHNINSKSDGQKWANITAVCSH